MKEVKKIIENAFVQCGYEGDYGYIINSKMSNEFDYQCNDGFKVAKQYKTNPVEVGKKVVAFLNESNVSKTIENVSFSNPGFINIKLSDSFVLESANNIIKSRNFGLPQHNGTVVLDYGGANIAKPMHVGHLRSAVIGNSINNLYRLFGFKTISDVHLGDFGLQMGQVIYGLQKSGLAEECYFDSDYNKEYPKNPLFNIKDLQKVYPEVSALCKENEGIKKTCAVITKELQNEREGYVALFNHIYEVSIKDLKEGYGYLGIEFDLWLGEKDSYTYVSELESILLTENLLVEDDGAMIVHVKSDSDNKEFPPLLFKKSNGAYLYGSTDLATIYQRQLDFSPNEIVYVVDKRQSLHFEQVKRVAEKVSRLKDINIEHYGFGTMNGKDGKPFKTRSGGALILSDLFDLVKTELRKKNNTEKNISNADEDMIVNAVIKFADLQTHRETDYVFELDKFTEFTGKTGPYAQYTTVRIKKLVRDLESELNQNASIDYSEMTDYERKLLIKILDAPRVLTSTFKEKSFNLLVDYIYEICNLSNSVYQNVKLKDEKNKSVVHRVTYNLSLSVELIENLLSVIGIDVPEKM